MQKFADYPTLIQKAQQTFTSHQAEDVEDAIGNVILNMLEVDEIIDNPESYFMKSVKNRLINTTKRYKFLQEKEESMVYNLFGSKNPITDMDELTEKECIEFINASLPHLSEGKADVIRLVLENKTNPEIAAQLNIEINNVQQRRYLAILELKELFRLSKDDFFNK